MTGIDYEVEYNNRARVPEESGADRGLGNRCRRLSRTTGAAFAVYGSGTRNLIDFFDVDGKGPIVVFIHGGYWASSIWTFRFSAISLVG